MPCSQNKVETSDKQMHVRFCDNSFFSEIYPETNLKGGAIGSFASRSI